MAAIMATVVSVAAAEVVERAAVRTGWGTWEGAAGVTMVEGATGEVVH